MNKFQSIQNSFLSFDQDFSFTPYLKEFEIMFVASPTVISETFSHLHNWIMILKSLKERLKDF